jgi:hypothetical protein
MRQARISSMENRSSTTRKAHPGDPLRDEGVRDERERVIARRGRQASLILPVGGRRHLELDAERRAFPPELQRPVASRLRSR